MRRISSLLLLPALLLILACSDFAGGTEPTSEGQPAGASKVAENADTDADSDTDSDTDTDG